MKNLIIGMDLATENDKTAYTKLDKKTGKIIDVYIVENPKTT